jgi:hypothetical protein
MINDQIYTPEQLQNKFIACSLLLSGEKPVLDCVRYAGGVNADRPVLYNSIASAEEDKFFADDWDKVIPASEYFQRVKDSNFKFDV